MKAIAVRNAALVWEEQPDPVRKRREVLVRIHAAGVNRADLLQRKGLYPPPRGCTDIMGLECAGEIVECGSEHGAWKLGDKVCALLPGGGYAQYVAVPHSLLLPIPEGMSYERAAALPEVMATAYLNLFSEGKLRSGERCVVHAGASGVGTAAIQLAHLAGAEVFTTVGSAEKAALCTALGAALAINYREEDVAARIVEATQGMGVDVILDVVGSAYLAQNIDMLRYRGRLVLIGLLGGVQGNLNLARVLSNNLRIVGSTLRNRSLPEKARLLQHLATRVWPAVESGAIQPIVDSVYAIGDIEDAHARMKNNLNMGKIVLSIP